MTSLCDHHCPAFQSRTQQKRRTYLRQQDLSIVSVSCSLVHQTESNHSSNLQEAQTTKSLFNSRVWRKHLRVFVNKRDCLEMEINAITLGRNSSGIITGACTHNDYGHCNFTGHNGNFFSLSLPLLAKPIQGQKSPECCAARPARLM